MFIFSCLSQTEHYHFYFFFFYDYIYVWANYNTITRFSILWRKKWLWLQGSAMHLPRYSERFSTFLCCCWGFKVKRAESLWYSGFKICLESFYHLPCKKSDFLKKSNTTPPLNYSHKCEISFKSIAKMMWNKFKSRTSSLRNIPQILQVSQCHVCSLCYRVPQHRRPGC